MGSRYDGRDSIGYLCQPVQRLKAPRYIEPLHPHIKEAVEPSLHWRFELYRLNSGQENKRFTTPRLINNDCAGNPPATKIQKHNNKDRSCW
jgi:hypothetical protein